MNITTDVPNLSSPEQCTARLAFFKALYYFSLKFCRWRWQQFVDAKWFQVNPTFVWSWPFWLLSDNLCICVSGSWQFARKTSRRFAHSIWWVEGLMSDELRLPCLQRWSHPFNQHSRHSAHTGSAASYCSIRFIGCFQCSWVYMCQVFLHKIQ